MPEKLWLDLEQYQPCSADLPAALCSAGTGWYNVKNIIEAILQTQSGKDPLALSCRCPHLPVYYVNRILVSECTEALMDHAEMFLIIQPT